MYKSVNRMNISGYLKYDNNCLYVSPSQPDESLYECTYLPQLIITHEVINKIKLPNTINLEKVYFAGDEEGLLFYLDMLDTIKNPSTNHQLRLTLLLNRFLQTIRISSGKNRFQDKLRIDIEDYINHNLHASLKIIDLAKRFGLNQQYFKVQFKNSFATSVHDYIKNKRLDHALILIKNENQSMSEIASSVGYSSTSSFSQAFKLKFGKSPIHYRISKY